MKSSRSFLAFAMAMIIVIGCEEGHNGSDNNTTVPSASLSSQIDSVSYAIGYQVGNSLKAQDFFELDYDNYIAGLNTGLKGDEGIFDDQEAFAVANTYREELRLRGDLCMHLHADHDFPVALGAVIRLRFRLGIGKLGHRAISENLTPGF